MRLALLGLLAAVFSAPADAQYSGPAVEACRAHAKKELQRERQAKDIVFDRDSALTIERYDMR